MGSIQIVNIIPRSMSGETHQDSESSIAVNPQNPMSIVATAFTPNPLALFGSTVPADSYAPIYASSDGGSTWSLNMIVPGGNTTSGTGDISVAFADSGGTFYAATLNGTTHDMQILRTASFTANTPMTVLVDRADEDQPWVVAATTLVNNTPRDRVYVGNLSGGYATYDRSLDAATAAVPAGFAGKWPIDSASAGKGDSPPTRIAIHPSGTLYAAFLRWTQDQSSAGDTYFDVVMKRDDTWGSSATPFQALGANGSTVAAGRFVKWGATMGQERLAADLAIAVDPHDPSTVWVAWCDRAGGPTGTDYTIHVRRSTDKGVTWSGDLRTITNAKNPALAINSNSQLALLYQAYTVQGLGSLSLATRWVTTLELTFDGWTTPADSAVLHTADATVPKAVLLPYIGDYVRMIAIGPTFYGVFCGNNTPSHNNFPCGITYQRNANWSTGTLLALDGSTPVAPSIDPFFFRLDPTPPLPF
jgi:hypothetical protein